MHIVAMVFKRGCGNILLDMDPHVRTFAIFDDSFSTKERFVEDSAVVGFRITILPFTEIFVSCFSRTTCLDVWRLSNLWKKILVSMADFGFLIYGTREPRFSLILFVGLWLNPYNLWVFAVLAQEKKQQKQDMRERNHVKTCSSAFVVVVKRKLSCLSNSKYCARNLVWFVTEFLTSDLPIESCCA